MGKKKLPPPQVVRVAVTSDIPEFKDRSIQNFKAHMNETWADVLKKHQITFNPVIHCLKSPKRSVVPLVTEKIGEYVAQYKTRREIYKVEIKYLYNRDKACIDKRLQPKSQRSSKRIRNARVQSERIHNAVSQNLPASRLLRRPEKIATYEEDDWGHILPVPVPTVDSHPNQEDLNDDAASMISQESQDSQDPGDNLKAVIIDKLLKQVTNGDMHRIRKELISLKESQKTMKVSRYIPATLNMVQNIFAE